MSRIEEALKRVELDGSHRLTVVGASDTAERSLAEYPAEARLEAAGARSVATRSTNRPSGPLTAVPPKTAPVTLPSVVQSKLILSDAGPVAVEQYRRLAAALLDLQAVRGTKVLMVASALPREGKTLTVTNLALTLSASYGRRVLLIDADLRRPSIHEVFRLPNATGLSDGLRSSTGPLTILPVTPLLSVLPAGRADSNPTAGLTSERMQQLIDEASAVFDWVLLDAPPVGIMPDATLLARLAQGVIFVIAAGSTPYLLIERAVAEIGRDSIVGTVLNRIACDAIPATSYYQDYYGSAAVE